MGDSLKKEKLKTVLTNIALSIPLDRKGLSLGKKITLDRGLEIELAWELLKDVPFRDN